MIVVFNVFILGSICDLYVIVSIDAVKHADLSVTLDSIDMQFSCK